MNHAVACGLLLVLAGGCRHSEEPAPSPARASAANILLITLDTTRADHLSCYRDKTPSANRRFNGATTPNMDALAARGVLFLNATAQTPLTLPSHASIMSGKYPTVHGLRGMEGFSFDQSHATLASITQENGFATAAFLDHGFSRSSLDSGADSRSMTTKWRAKQRRTARPESSPSGEQMR